MQDWISSTKPIVFSSSRKYVKLFFHFHLNQFIVNSLPSMNLEPLNNIHCKNYIKLWIDATCFINNIMDLLLVLSVVCLFDWIETWLQAALRWLLNFFDISLHSNIFFKTLVLFLNGDVTRKWSSKAASCHMCVSACESVWGPMGESVWYAKRMGLWMRAWKIER